MEQESTYNIAVIGLGAAGGFVSVLLCKNPYCKVTGFDIKEPFSTLLPTGGGRCNLSNATFDFKEIAKNYPRGEKFIMSVFSKFGVQKTLNLFEDLGIKTYTQSDNRIFPVSDSSVDVIKKLSKHLKCNNFKLNKEKVTSIKKEKDKFVLNGKYIFDYVVIATGGKGFGYELAKQLEIKVTDLKPSLCSLDIMENYLYKLSGLCFKDVEISAKIGNKKFSSVSGDILFAHKFITGPAIFKMSALSAFDEFNENTPLELTIRLTDLTKEDIENELKSSSKKTVKNAFSKFVSENFILEILKANNIDENKQSAQLKKQEKEILINSITELKLHATKRIKDSEIVTAGGIDLDEINSKTMEAKNVEGLYFAGEVLNIDGFTGGYNLQNCWSTAQIIANNFN